MTVLSNAKHELFAQELAKGETASAAYVTAGYQADDGNASKLANRPEVQARVQEITGAAAERAGVTTTQVFDELRKIAFADIRDVVSWRPELVPLKQEIEESGEEVEPDGLKAVMVSRVTVLDSATLSEDAAAAVAEVAQSATGAIRIKLHDKPAALEKLARMLGMFKDRVEHTGKDGGPIETRAVLTDRDRARALAHLVAKAKTQDDDGRTDGPGSPDRADGAEGKG